MVAGCPDQNIDQSGRGLPQVLLRGRRQRGKDLWRCREYHSRHVCFIPPQEPGQRIES